MGLKAVSILMVALAFFTAQCNSANPSSMDAARALFAQYMSNQGSKSGYMVPSTPATVPVFVPLTSSPRFSIRPSGSGQGNSQAGICYTANQDEGSCVKSSMCDMDPVKVESKRIFQYRSLPKTGSGCSFLEVCCPKDKIRRAPVPPTASTALGCGYSNPSAGKFRESMGTSDSGYADFAEYPWMVALMNRSTANQNSDGWKYFGRGTLISPNLVMTVAHKVSNLTARDLKCRAGEWDTENENEDYLHQDRNVRQIVIHPHFDEDTANYDIALLVMDTPFVIKPHINVACLSPTLPPPGTLCYSMGWGMDFTKGKSYASVLKKIPLPLMAKRECEQKFRAGGMEDSYTVHPSLTCAGGQPNVDTCTGDGGSSLVCPMGAPSDLRYSVVGMVVHGIGCGSSITPGAYANVPYLYQWVDNQMYLQSL